MENDLLVIFKSLNLMQVYFIELRKIVIQ